jgi:hypothetical protein
MFQNDSALNENILKKRWYKIQENVVLPLMNESSLTEPVAILDPPVAKNKGRPKKTRTKRPFIGPNNRIKSCLEIKGKRKRHSENESEVLGNPSAKKSKVLNQVTVLDDDFEECSTVKQYHSPKLIIPLEYKFRNYDYASDIVNFSLVDTDYYQILYVNFVIYFECTRNAKSCKDSRPLISIKGNQISPREVSLLVDGCWLNDEVINAYLGLFRRDDVLIMSSFFFELVKLKKKSLMPFKSVVHLVIPVNLRNCHWALFIVNLQDGQIIVFDSLQSHFAMNDYKEHIDLLQLFLKANLPLKIAQNLCPFNVSVRDSIQQDDQINCGVLTILNAKRFLLNQRMRSPVKNLTKIRDKMALDLIAPFLQAHEAQDDVIKCYCDYDCKYQI